MCQLCVFIGLFAVFNFYSLALSNIKPPKLMSHDCPHFSYILQFTEESETCRQWVLCYCTALPSHIAEGLQRNLDNISATYKSAGLLINVKKTEVVTQPAQRGAHSAHPVFTVNNVTLTNVEHFTYLGSVLSADCDITHEVQQRIKSASAALGRLSSRVFFNHNLTIDTKVAVYKACAFQFYFMAVNHGLCTGII